MSLLETLKLRAQLAWLQLVSKLCPVTKRRRDNFAVHSAFSHKMLNIKEADGSCGVPEQSVLQERALPAGKVGVVLAAVGKACACEFLLCFLVASS